MPRVIRLLSENSSSPDSKSKFVTLTDAMKSGLKDIKGDNDGFLLMGYTH